MVTIPTDENYELDFAIFYRIRSDYVKKNEDESVKCVKFLVVPILVLNYYKAVFR